MMKRKRTRARGGTRNGEKGKGRTRGPKPEGGQEEPVREMIKSEEGKGGTGESEEEVGGYERRRDS